MATAADRTHYQVLGVTQGASAEQIRTAHRQLARVLHPDRLGAATSAERGLAERRMREVNAAWTVLSDPARRGDYDRSLAAARVTRPAGAKGGTTRTAGSTAGAAGHFADADDPDAAFERNRLAQIDDEMDLAPAHFWLLRRGPVVAAVLVGLLLFVVTAYAGGNAVQEDGAQPVRTTVPARDCVRLVEGRTSVRTSCDGDHDGRIVTVVDQPLDCPDSTRYVVLDDQITCVTDDPAVSSSTPTVVGE